MEYCGIGQNKPINPICTKDGFASITVMGNTYAILDIYLRMLNPGELKSGQGFPEDYITILQERK